jgi:uncharacterized coiled-coil protein SlyX
MYNGSMNKSETTLDDVISAIGDMFAEQNDRLDLRFNGLETRMDNLEARMDSLESRMTSLEIRVGTVESAIKSLSGRVKALEADIGEIYEMLQKLDKNTVKKSDLIKFVTRLEIAEKSLTELKASRA